MPLCNSTIEDQGFSNCLEKSFRYPFDDRECLYAPNGSYNVQSSEGFVCADRFIRVESGEVTAEANCHLYNRREMPKRRVVNKKAQDEDG